MSTQLFFCLLHVTLLINGVPSSPTCLRPPGLDLIGQFRLTNRLQCQRLCWYQSQCEAFRYCDVSTEGYNCLLYHRRVTGSHPVEEASGGNLNACASRPCAKSEVCLPRGVARGSRDQRYRCLSVDCGDGPEPPTDHSFYNWTGSHSGDLSIATCDVGYFLAPRDVTPAAVRCDVTGRWMSVQPGANFSCRQAEFHNATLPFVRPLPWPLSDGWGSCFLGKFKDITNGLDISFVENPVGDLDEAENVPFITRIGASSFNMWGVKTGSAWAKMELNRNLFRMSTAPRPGYPFRVAFRLTQKGLRVTLNGTVLYTVMAGSDVQLDTVRYLTIFNDHSLEYISVTSPAACL